MKKTTTTLLFFLITLYSYSQNTALETEIRELEQRSVRAILQKDSATLRKLWSPAFMVNAPTNRVLIGGQVEMVMAGVISYTSYIKETEKVLIKGDMVITMGNETVVPVMGNPNGGKTIKRRYTNIWMKENGNWMMIARQASETCQQ